MTQFRGRLFLKILPMTAIIASAHIALAAEPEAPVNPATTEFVTASSPITLTGPAPVATPAPTIQMVATPDIDPAPVDTDEAQPDPRQIECIAKVIVHEAGNQPRRGQVAVAQVIRTRVKDGRFGSDACSVVKQRGQFFDVASYEPSRTSARWTTAVDIATETLNGEGDEVVPGALFFHSAGASMRGRVRVAQVADHTFYR